MTYFLSYWTPATKQRVLLGCLMGALTVAQGCDDDQDAKSGEDGSTEQDGGGDGGDGTSTPDSDAGSRPDDGGSQPDGGDGLDAGGGEDGSVGMDGGGSDAGDLVDAGEPDASVAEVHGLRGDYYRGSSFISYAASRIDPTIDLTIATEVPPIALPDDQLEFPGRFYSVRWLGYIEPEVTATYKFLATADDGERLWIDGEKILDSWAETGIFGVQTDESSLVELQAGVRYPIRLDMFQHTGAVLMRLEWESTDGAVTRQVVPTERLIALPLDQPPPSFLTFEAESRANTATGGSAVDPVNNPVPIVDGCDNCSGYYRTPLKLPPDSGSITFNVNVGEAGTYLLQVWFANKGNQGTPRYLNPSKGTLSVNGGAEQEVLFPNNWNQQSVWDSVDFEVPLVLGENTITIAGTSDGEDKTNIDRITLRLTD